MALKCGMVGDVTLFYILEDSGREFIKTLGIALSFETFKYTFFDKYNNNIK